MVAEDALPHQLQVLARAALGRDGPLVAAGQDEVVAVDGDRHIVCVAVDPTWRPWAACHAAQLGHTLDLGLPVPGRWVPYVHFFIRQHRPVPMRWGGVT